MLTPTYYAATIFKPNDDFIKLPWHPSFHVTRDRVEPHLKTATMIVVNRLKVHPQNDEIDVVWKYENTL